jgi:hypothetical protein
MTDLLVCQQRRAGDLPAIAPCVVDQDARCVEKISNTGEENNYLCWIPTGTGAEHVELSGDGTGTVV